MSTPTILWQVRFHLNNLVYWAGKAFVFKENFLTLSQNMQEAEAQKATTERERDELRVEVAQLKEENAKLKEQGVREDQLIKKIKELTEKSSAEKAGFKDEKERLNVRIGALKAQREKARQSLRDTQESQSEARQQPAEKRQLPASSSSSAAIIDLCEVCTNGIFQIHSEIGTICFAGLARK